MRIAFMGSPAEVISPLKQLLHAPRDLGFEVVLVVSQPARPVGRSGQLQDPPLAAFAKSVGIPVLQPESARDPDFLDEFRSKRIDVVVTAAYGQILSQKFLAIPKRATINIHPSMLPQYRGATPVPAALLSGDLRTGVSILFTVKALDAGALIAVAESEIFPDETAGALTSRMFDLGGSELIKALQKLRDPDFNGIPQDDAHATFCKKIEKADGQVDWNREAAVNYNRFRAFHPWPGSFSFFAGKRVTFLDMSFPGELPVPDSLPPEISGAFIFSKRFSGLLVRSGSSLLVIRRLQLEGGKPVDAASFWNGIKDRTSCRFGAMNG